MQNCALSPIPIKQFFPLPSGKPASSVQFHNFFPICRNQDDYRSSFKIVYSRRLSNSHRFCYTTFGQRRNCRKFMVNASGRGESPYEVLGVSPSATSNEIKRAYRKLALKYHPDVSKEANSQEMFIKIKDAYNTLLNSKTRKRYDSQTYISCSIGVSWIKPTTVTGFGAVIKKGQRGADEVWGDVVWSVATPLEAEVEAIRWFLRMAYSKGWRRILIRSDAKSAVDMINGRRVIEWDVYRSVSYIMRMREDFEECGLLYVKRKCNVASHSAAHYARSNSAEFIWETPYPAWLSTAISLDDNRL